MGLKKLILRDFKSYRGELVVPFDGTPFVSVVGPNGSGKSNMLDAICFVIGMSPGRLRSQSIDALVHRGSHSEMSVAAEIELDGRVYLLRRTPERFEVDGQEVAQAEYCRQWAALNVFPDARNCVVLQGDVDKVTDPIELATFIENLAPGSIESDRKKYDEISRELAEAGRESRKYLSARRTVQARLDEAEDVGQAGAKLAALQEEVVRLTARRRKLAKLEKQAALAAHRREIAQAQAELVESREESELVSADAKRVRAEYARKRKHLLSARKAEQEAMQAVQVAETEFAVFEKKHQAVTTELRVQLPDLEAAEQAVEFARKDAEQAERALARLDRANDAARRAAEEEEELPLKLRERWMQLENEFVAETAVRQDVLNQFRQRRDQAERELATAERLAHDHESEQEVSEARVLQQRLRVEQLRGIVKEFQDQEQAHKEELDEIMERGQTLQRERRETSENLQDLNVKVRKADGNKRAIQKRHRLLDAVERMRRANPQGVFDLLGNLVTPLEEQFAVALERGLAAHADAIVVDTAETALSCIEQSRRERLGSFEFLPLADLQGRELASSRAQLAKEAASTGARLLLDCAHFEQRFRSAVLFSLGNAAFVPTFAQGRALRATGATMRILDARGSVISANNTVSASFGADSDSSRVSDRSLAMMERKIAALAEKLRAGAAEEQELGDREVRVGAQIERAIEREESTKRDLEVAEKQLESAERVFEHLRAQEMRFSDDVSTATEAFRAAAAEFKEQEDQLADERAFKFEPFLVQAGGALADWDARFARGVRRFAELTSQRQLAEKHLQTATEHLQLVSQQLERQRARRQTLISANTRIDGDLETSSTELHAARQRLERATGRVQSLRSEAESRSDEVGAAESAMEAAKARLAEAEREEHRREMALAAEIGATGNDEEDDNEDDEDERPARKRKRGSVAFNDAETLSLDRLDAKIRDLKAEIEPLVTLMSMVKTRKGKAKTNDSEVGADLDKKAAELRKKSDELMRQFNELKLKRARRFDLVFASLQQEVSLIYHELVGGDAQAKLVVAQHDTPFAGVDFVVMPPNKPFTPIAQLSGGERSMASLALLFAGQQLLPAPFVALDEVDAALDFVNVASVANYIRSHSISTQFIVVSLKQRLFQTASHLVGVYKQRIDSKILTVAL